MATTKAVTDDTFADEVLRADKPVLVDFWADWCAPCRKIAPMLEELADEMGDRLQIVKLDADHNPQTVRDYRVMSLPTLAIFRNGEQVKALVGATSKSKLVKFVNEAIEA